MKKNFFKNPLFAKLKKFRMLCVWNTNFFTRQAITKISFVLHSTYAGDTPCRLWLCLDNSLARSKRPIFNFRYSRKSQVYFWKFIFFPRRVMAKILFLLQSTYTGDTAYQVWLNLDNFLTQSEITIFKIANREIHKFTYENLIFARQA